MAAKAATKPLDNSKIKPAAGTAVAPQKQGGAVAGSTPDFSKYAGAGIENVTAKDLLIPRLTILQSLSPQVLKSKAEFIKEAKVGDICDVGLSEIITPPLIFLPVHFSKVWIEWKPKRGGLVMIHDNPQILESCAANDKKEMIVQSGDNKGNNVVETSQFFGINLSAGGRRSFIPMAVTQLRAARRWNTLVTGEKAEREDGSTYTPPIFYRTYSLEVAETSNDQGSWFVWKVERHTKLEEIVGWQSLFQEAVSFRESIVKGELRGDVGASAEEATGEEARM